MRGVLKNAERLVHFLLRQSECSLKVRILQVVVLKFKPRSRPVHRLFRRSARGEP